MRVLSDLGIHPILVDIGASGGAPTIWEPIAKHSVYLGFDPDLREIKQSAGGKFHKEIIVNEAITSERSKSSVEFYLTKFPFCSSTLEPDQASLANFHFHDRFSVQGKATVPATTLDSVLHRLSLDRVDWLKLDTQGTDLRIFMSLPENIRSRVLALDIEPGLIDAYRGEDLFADTHKALSKEGFWLSDLNIGSAVRVRSSSLKSVVEDDSLHYSFADRAIKMSPAYCEARYLRTLEWLSANRCDRKEYALLWTFATLDGQSGFAMDVALEYQKLFGTDVTGTLMKKDTEAFLQKKAARLLPAIRMKRRLKKALRG